MMGRFPHSLYCIKTLSTLPVSLKMYVKLQYMSHKCNSMAFVIDVLFSITDSRSLTSQKELAYVVASFRTQNFHFNQTWKITKKP